MCRSTGKGKAVAEETKSDSEDSMDSDESDEEDAREETPDLYRNSALGIYGGVSLFILCEFVLMARSPGNGRCPCSR